jgi:hypothetical protein
MCVANGISKIAKCSKYETKPNSQKTHVRTTQKAVIRQTKQAKQLCGDT